MDAKTELERRLVGLAPGMEAEIRQALEAYRITWAETGGGLALRERIESFLAAKRIDGLSPKTLKDYGLVLRSFARNVDRPPEEITADDVRRYLAGLSERGLKNGSIVTHANTLRSFFAWLTGEGLIHRNPMCRIRTRRVDRAATRKPLTAGELEQLRAACGDAREQALLSFLVTSGCRLSEAAGIRADQVDWRRRSIRITGKGRKTRTVYFSEETAVLLDAYIQEQGQGTPLFSTGGGTPLSPRSIQRLLRALGERAGLERRVHPHILRHTFATQALQGGMPLPMLQQLLGHEDPKTTMIYAEILPEAARAAYEKIFNTKGAQL